MSSGLRGKAVSSGPPVPCAQCRQPFNPSAVIGGRRARAAVGAVCPRCTKELKAEKKRRKEA